MGYLGQADAKNGELNSLTYVSPPEWEGVPPGLDVKTTNLF